MDELELKIRAVTDKRLYILDKILDYYLMKYPSGNNPHGTELVFSFREYYSWQLELDINWTQLSYILESLIDEGLLTRYESINEAV